VRLFGNPFDLKSRHDLIVENPYGVQPDSGLVSRVRERR
jgi:hypothetical protein